MFHNKKSSTMNSYDHRPMCPQGDHSGLVLTTDPKPRLRWTVELHERFIDAVAQLGGPDKATPKTIMRVMGVKGLTLYHLKSHLQKFRMGKNPHREFNDHSIKDGFRTAASAQEIQRNNASSSGMNRSMNDDAIRMQMEVQRRLHEQLEVQRHLQLRIEAQGKYMQSILERACQTLTSENNKDIANHGVPEMAPGSQLNFPSFHDLNLYGGGDQDHHLDHHQQQQHSTNRSSSSGLDHGFVPDSDNNFIAKKRPSPIFGGSGKSPLIWSNDHRLDDGHIQIALSSIERGPDIDSFT